MNKIDIIINKERPTQSRLIVNVNEDLSVGVIMKRQDLNKLKHEIENVLRKLSVEEISHSPDNASLVQVQRNRPTKKLSIFKRLIGRG
jgi:transcriptional/translational regulatory protein YebC/TACO1